MWADLGEVFPALTAQLDAYGAGTERNLIITGHSLGATLSGLFAARLAAEGRNVSGEGTQIAARVGGSLAVRLLQGLCCPVSWVPSRCSHGVLMSTGVERSNTRVPHAAVYTWASSRPGDERFAEAYRKLGLHDKTLR